MKKHFLITLLLLGGFYAGFAQNKAEDVKTFTLKNGMKILVLEDHSIPNANMYLFWKVGSRNEVPGITGLSHFFEHMMFNGAKKYGPKEFDRVMEANGGSNNAYTTADVTVYTDWFPSSALEVMFELEADRIGHLNIDEKMVESERGVVLSERSTGLENSNFRFLAEQVESVAFFAHPYKWPVIGYESDIKSWTKKDLEEYFKTYYAPNNAVVVIVGDVKLDQVKTLAQKYFEPIPAQTPPPAVRTIEPEQNGEKRLVVYKEISSPNVMLSYHTPETKHEDYYALELLSNLLSSGNSARLTKSLVYDQELATNVFAYQGNSFDPNLFTFYAIAANGVSPEEVEKGILAEIEKIQKEGVTERELQKVKNQKLIEFYQSVETIDGKANNIGTYELFFGDYKKLFEAPKLFEKVSIEDIKRVANTYFTKKNCTVGYLISENQEEKSE
jgi:predicted Zn-dependent peptidase